MAEKEIERIYVVPFNRVKHGPVSEAAPRAMREVRRFLSKHMKVEAKDIWIDESVNHAIWNRGKYKIPSKLRVRAVKFDDGVVEVSLPEIEFKSFREELKTIKESKEPILKREEEEEEETKEEGTEEETIEEEKKEEKSEEEPVTEKEEEVAEKKETEKEDLSEKKKREVKEEKPPSKEKPTKEKPKESKKPVEEKTSSEETKKKTEKKK